MRVKCPGPGANYCRGGQTPTRPSDPYPRSGPRRPFKTCPRCNGEGMVVYDGWHAEWHANGHPGAASGAGCIECMIEEADQATRAMMADNAEDW